MERRFELRKKELLADCRGSAGAIAGMMGRGGDVKWGVGTLLWPP